MVHARALAAVVVVLCSMSSADARGGGSGVSSAVLIQALPYSDIGLNEDADNNYDFDCPGNPGEYDGKDQWYRIIASESMTVRITTCSPVTDFDTKLYVFRDVASHGAVVACNDDFCSGGLGLPYVAEIERVTLQAGHTYFIVVDAYSESDEGTFRLQVESLGVVAPACPGDATQDGVVNVDDLNAVLGSWQGSVTPGVGPDLSGDGAVNVDDLNAVLGNWQTACD